MKRRRMVERWQDDNKMFLSLNIKKRMLPTLYGAIVGDMLGVPVEFKKRDTYSINGVEGYGTYNQPPGTWSDDTSLTLCLIENINNCGTKNDLMLKFIEYVDEGYLTPYNQMFDIGKTTVDAIERFKSGIPPQKCGGTSEYDNGNGALMRIAPLVFILFNNFNFVEKAEIIKQYTEITHAHPRSIVGSIIYIELLIRLYYNNPLSKCISEIHELFDENFSKQHVYQEELKHYLRIFSESFLETPRDDIFSDGYVVHTLEAAIWCLGNSRSFREAVLLAVNLGNDTDTVASLTGALAGMHYKLEEIPKEWLDKIARKSDVDDLINKFHQICANKAIVKEYGNE